MTIAGGRVAGAGATADAPVTSATKWKRYPAYKDSGVEWLGEVPAHWNRLRLKRTVTACQNGIWGDESTGEDDVYCIRVADFDRVTRTIDGHDLTLRSVPRSKRDGRLLKPGDLLLEKSGGGDLQPVGTVVLFDLENLDAPAVCSNFIARMPVADLYNPRFLNHLHEALYAAGINTRSIKQNIGIQNLDSDQYLSELVVIPPFDEQRAIAGFLGRETEHIDTLIAKKERLIELLEEKRTALISHAVTKGLDPDAPMKDSGVEWLGEVPAHWDVARTKFVAQLESGHTPSRSHPEYWENCTIPWFTLADVWQLRDGRRIYLKQTKEHVSELGLANSAARLLPAGTVILSRTASVGFSGILSRPMATTQDFVNWICGPQLQPEYLYYVFHGMKPEFRRLTMGSTHQTIYMPDVEKFVTPVPPRHEQSQIVQHVDRETTRLDTLADKVRAAMDTLREYRTALISAAVFGKIDVREEAAP